MSCGRIIDSNRWGTGDIGEPVGYCAQVRERCTWAGLLNYPPLQQRKPLDGPIHIIPYLDELAIDGSQRILHRTVQFELFLQQVLSLAVRLCTYIIHVPAFRLCLLPIAHTRHEL